MITPGLWIYEVRTDSTPARIWISSLLFCLPNYHSRQREVDRIIVKLVGESEVVGICFPLRFDVMQWICISVYCIEWQIEWDGMSFRCLLGAFQYYLAKQVYQSSEMNKKSRVIFPKDPTSTTAQSFPLCFVFRINLLFLEPSVRKSVAYLHREPASVEILEVCAVPWCRSQCCDWSWWISLFCASHRSRPVHFLNLLG